MGRGWTQVELVEHPGEHAPAIVPLRAAQELLGGTQPELQILLAGSLGVVGELEVDGAGLGPAARVHHGARQARAHIMGIVERPRRCSGLLVDRERLAVQPRGAIERQRSGSLIRGQDHVARGLLEIASRVEVHGHGLGAPRGVARARRAW